MAIGIIILGISSVGIFCLFMALNRFCKDRDHERSLVKFLAQEIRNLRRDVDKLKK